MPVHERFIAKMVDFGSYFQLVSHALIIIVSTILTCYL